MEACVILWFLAPTLPFWSRSNCMVRLLWYFPSLGTSVAAAKAMTSTLWLAFREHNPPKHHHELFGVSWPSYNLAVGSTESVFDKALPQYWQESIFDWRAPSGDEKYKIRHATGMALSSAIRYRSVPCSVKRRTCFKTRKYRLWIGDGDERMCRFFGTAKLLGTHFFIHCQFINRFCISQQCLQNPHVFSWNTSALSSAPAH